MALDIFWTPEAILSFNHTTEYIEKEWTTKELNKFVHSTFKVIEQISKMPETFDGVTHLL